MKISEIINQYERFCPKELAFEGDPVGLQIGDINAEVSKVLVALNVREQTINEAIELGVNLIIVKHPLIFSKLSTLLDSHFQERIILECIRHDIAIYVSHTNIDVVSGGLNDYFCEKLEIFDTEVLAFTDSENGIGRVGNIKPMTYNEFVLKVKEKFNLSHVISVNYNQNNRIINRVAICGGSGGKFYTDALDKKADVYITGDIYYHTAHDMLSQNLLAIDPGHHIERDFTVLIENKLKKWSKAYNWPIEVFQSQANTNPFKIV